MSKCGDILREPLLVFVLLGGLIYVAYAHFSPGDSPQIVVTEAAINDLVTERESVLNRPLEDAEQKVLIASFVDREILVHEAIARGLYLRDPKIHRRLADKMAFLLDDEAPEPTAAQLQAQFDAHRENYLTPRTVTFEHVFFRSDRARAERAMAAIHSGSALPEDLGEIFWLGRRMDDYSSKQLLILLGFEFDRTVRGLPVGEWRGPIKSARGWHLVRVEQRHEPRVLPEAELRRQLVADWKTAWGLRQREQQLAELRRRYDVVYPKQGS